jgi:hypothetical protein
VTHKEEEWFKQKYHPDDSTLRKEELKVFLSFCFKIRISPRPGSFFFSDRIRVADPHSFHPDPDTAF